jgi:hypothetical protein
VLSIGGKNHRHIRRWPVHTLTIRFQFCLSSMINGVTMIDTVTREKTARGAIRTMLPSHAHVARLMPKSKIRPNKSAISLRANSWVGRGQVWCPAKKSSWTSPRWRWEQSVLLCPSIIRVGAAQLLGFLWYSRFWNSNPRPQISSAPM